MSTTMKVFIAVICCAFSSNTALAAPSPSFDCAKAGTKVEKAICSNEELANLDKSLSDAYISLKKNLTATEVKALKDSQRMWMKQRDTSCGSDVPCLRETYSSRLSELARQKQLLAQKKYQGFVFEPVEWSIGEYKSTFGRKATPTEQEIENILIKDNKFLDRIEMNSLTVDTGKVLAKVYRGLTFDEEKSREFDSIDSIATQDKKLTRVETLIAVFDLEKKSYLELWSTKPAIASDERGKPMSPLFKLDLNRDGIMDYFTFTWVGGDTHYAKGSEVLRVFDGKTWEKWLEMEMYKPDFCIVCDGEPWGPGVSKVKMFALDFDRNDKLDILFWRKNYSGHPESKEYALSNEEFFHFEEGEGGFPQSAITEKQARALLKEHHLTWKSGFPTNKDALCMQTGEEKYCKR